MKTDTMKTTHHFTAKIFAGLLALFLVLSPAASTPELDAVSFDPAVVSAGDTVTISANMHARDFPDKVWDEDKHLKVVLKPGNRLAREHVTIVENRDESIGFLYPQGTWNQNFKVDVASDAPTGDYEFELHIQYLENGEPVQIPTEDGSANITVIEEFTMPVDKEGVALTSTVEKTSPKQPRPGDDYVSTSVRVTNSGNKPVEEIELVPETPKNVKPAYSQDEKFFIGRLNPGQSTTIDLGLELDEDLSEGRHTVRLRSTYEDTDSNRYTEELEVPLRVEGRPDLEIDPVVHEMEAGGEKALSIKIRNTGAQDAESVTARIIAERTQPFSLEDRSDYVGEIQAGETAEAVLRVGAERDAALKEHNLKVQLRTTGDSEEGDHSVYTFTEHTKVNLAGRTESPLIYVGVLGAIIVAATLGYRIRNGGEKEDGKETDS
ncbi:MAG: COG1361 S-layer family protein [Candidatus Nanohaloarchaea archaeon]